ncbi:hypothetical protein RRG08_054785 [Elysia crispata]|uniref:Uncharacterized protein n=1 Tax=Elysia crispata TaxID=231223 RepID=A0AAE1ACQ8_9GAST|nr:hypothetical protein RRG08_054785 [Elysia crispata]
MIVKYEYRLNFTLDNLKTFFGCLCNKKGNQMCSVDYHCSTTSETLCKVKSIQTKTSSSNANQGASLPLNVIYDCDHFVGATAGTTDCSVNSTAKRSFPDLEDLDANLKNLCDFRCIAIEFPIGTKFINFGRGPFGADMFCMQPYDYDDRKDIGKHGGVDNKAGGGGDKNGHVDNKVDDHNKADRSDGNRHSKDHFTKEAGTAHQNAVREKGLSTKFLLVVLGLCLSLIVNIVLCSLWFSRLCKAGSTGKRCSSSSRGERSDNDTICVENMTYLGAQAGNGEIRTGGRIRESVEHGSEIEMDDILANNHEDENENTYNIPGSIYQEPRKMPLSNDTSIGLRFNNAAFSNLEEASTLPVYIDSDAHYSSLDEVDTAGSRIFANGIVNGEASAHNEKKSAESFQSERNDEERSHPALLENAVGGSNASTNQITRGRIENSSDDLVEPLGNTADFAENNYVDFPKNHSADFVENHYTELPENHYAVPISFA